LTLIGASILMWAFIICLFFAYGYYETWSLWGVPFEKPPFVDFRVLPIAAEAFRVGMDPALLNPNDPLGRLFNYPKIWYLLFYTGITKEDKIWLSIVLIVLFFVSVFAFPEKLRIQDALLMILIAFSSAAMLLYERGNVDLVLFILCSLIVLLMRRSQTWAAVLLSFAAILKLYPFFGVGVFLQENRDRFYKYLLISALIFDVYITLSIKSLKAAWSLTPRGTYLSYGDYVIFKLLHDEFHFYLLKFMAEDQVVIFMRILPHMVALSLLVIVFLFGKRSKNPLGTETQGNLTAFRMGACIYLGTFLFGNTWDYRLIFLIFTIPQISSWMSYAPREQRFSVFVTFFAMLISCWYTLLRNYFLLAGGYELYFNIFDETMNWIVFGGLAYLLVLSAPQWFRMFNWFSFSKTQRVQVQA
jgi:hypothetical protein